MFTLVHQEVHYPIAAAPREYSSLMHLISLNLGIVGFGLCSGMGSCGTCMVAIHSRQQYRSVTHSLSCGRAITEDLANATIIIPNEYY